MYDLDDQNNIVPLFRGIGFRPALDFVVLQLYYFCLLNYETTYILTGVDTGSSVLMKTDSSDIRTRELAFNVDMV